MADISKIIFPSGKKYNIKDTIARTGSNIYIVKGTQTTITGAWTGNIDIDALYDGLTISYYLPRTGNGNASLNLTLNNGTTTGDVPVYITSTTRATTHYGAGSTIILTYWSAGSISVNGTSTTQDRWTSADSLNSNTIGEYAGSCIAGPNGMAKYSLIMKVSEDKWESLVRQSTSGTTKTKNTSGFLINSPILYQSENTYASGGVAGQNSCWLSVSMDTRYSHNGGAFATAGQSFYLVGTIQNGLFYLKDTTWWSKNLPSTEDGYIYIYIGQFYNGNNITLYPCHPKFKYYAGKVRTYEEAELIRLNQPKIINYEPILDFPCLGVKVTVFIPTLFSELVTGSRYIQCTLGDNIESVNVYPSGGANNICQYNCIFNNASNFGDTTALCTNISITHYYSTFTDSTSFNLGTLLLNIIEGKGTLEQKKKAMAIYNYCYYVHKLFGKLNSNYSDIPILPSIITDNKRLLPSDEDNVYLNLLLPYKTTFNMGTSGLSNITTTIQIYRSGDFGYQLNFKASTAALANSISLSQTPNAGFTDATYSQGYYQRTTKFGYKWDELNTSKSLTITTSSGNTTILIEPLRYVRGLIQNSNVNYKNLGRAITQLFLNYCYGAYEQYWKARVETSLT